MQTRYLLAVFSDATACESERRGIDDRLLFARRDFPGRASLWTRHREQVCHIAGGNGVALGLVVARRESATRLHRSPARDFAPASDISLDDLLKETWGNYIAFETETSTDSATVLRSPLGTLAAYYVRTHWGWAFASDVDLLCDAGILAPSIDWNRLGEHLQRPVFQHTDTCLVGVRELMPGTAMTIEREGRSIRRSHWSYRDHMTPAAGGDAEAADRLREALVLAVSGMTDQDTRLAVSVSGGLDSSIVAACAVGAGVPVELFTLAGDDPDADERGFSRPLARYLGQHLHEFRFDADDVDLQRSSTRHLPRPLGHAHAQTLAAKCAILRDRFGIEAILTGMGGDNVFCSNFSSLPLVDRLQCEGPGRGAWETLKALEEITSATTLAIGWQALRTLCFGRRPDWRPGLAGFLSRDLGMSGPDPLGSDPRRPPRRELPGKVYHAEMIARVLPYVEGFDRAEAPALLSPLLAQPVVETCLAIPSWHWSASGQTRSVARMAFRGMLPPWIVNRLSKGGPDAFARDLALGRIAQLREIILDGELLRRGLLDRRRIEAALETASLFRFGHHSLLLHIADTEAWLRHWSGRGAAASPAVSVAGSLTPV